MFAIKGQVTCLTKHYCKDCKYYYYGKIEHLWCGKDCHYCTHDRYTYLNYGTEEIAHRLCGLINENGDCSLFKLKDNE